MEMERFDGKAKAEEPGAVALVLALISVNVKPARWRKAQRSTGFTTVQSGMKSGGIPEAFRKVGATGKNLTEGVEVAKKKHKSWSMPAEGFKGHVAPDGSVGSMCLGGGAIG